VFSIYTVIPVLTMKRQIQVLIALLLVSSALPLQAQFGGGGPTGPQLNPALVKLFGDHKAFSAELEFQVTEGGQGEAMSLPGKIAFQDGNSRFEMDLSNAKGGRIPPNAAAQMKQMGMDKLVSMSLPKKNVSYLIYPALESYVELPVENPGAAKTDAEFEKEVTEIGKEKIGAQECIKNKVVVTDKDGTTRESTVWNSVDLKKFPVKIETTEEGNLVVLLFKDVNFSKPDASNFVPPPAFTKYDNMMDMVQQVMMKRMGGVKPTGP